MIYLIPSFLHQLSKDIKQMKRSLIHGPRFGQAVIGPPGAGKTTYCHGIARFLSARGRPVAVVNLDPANDKLPFPVDIDVSELVNLAVRLGQEKGERDRAQSFLRPVLGMDPEEGCHNAMWV